MILFTILQQEARVSFRAITNLVHRFKITNFYIWVYQLNLLSDLHYSLCSTRISNKKSISSTVDTKSPLEHHIKTPQFNISLGKSKLYKNFNNLHFTKRDSIKNNQINAQRIRNSVHCNPRGGRQWINFWSCIGASPPAKEGFRNISPHLRKSHLDLAKLQPFFLFRPCEVVNKH